MLDPVSDGPAKQHMDKTIEGIVCYSLVEKLDILPWFRLVRAWH